MAKKGFELPESISAGNFYHIIIDIEASCWKGWENKELMEIIEIGAVKLDQAFELLSEFTTFIKPIKSPQLTPFCIELTSITQADVDAAPLFPEAYRLFTDWAGSEPFCWYSWGSYDHYQLMRDIASHEQAVHPQLEHHIDLRKAYAAYKGFDQVVGFRKALRLEGFQFEGRHHRGIDDAKNSAKLLRLIHSV